jgi:archaemetzincin
MHPMRSGESRRTLALLPIGVPVGDAAGNVPPGLLRTYAEAFFQMPTRLLPSVSLEEMQVRRRTNSFTGKEQLLAPDVLAYLKSKLPNDAFAVCGFTNEDLYPEESWNFVFGQASMWERVGVFSFARYDPTFFGAPREKGHERAMRRRCINVLAHETSHMFGLAHCVFFACLMNGSNHLAETDRRPFHACPVCLRKLHHAIGFDVVARYRALEAVYADGGFDDERRWTQERIAGIELTRGD